MAQRYCLQNRARLTFRIIGENFITSNKSIWQKQEIEKPFDIVICNPPYKKIPRKAPEALTMEGIVHGQPNIYFLFMAMALCFLRLNGSYLFIVPRSWTSGLYFTAFRDYFFNNINISQIHLFLSRDKVFDKEQVLQETMVLSGTRSENNQQQIIRITTSNGSTDFNNLNEFFIDKDSCIQTCNGRYFLLPSNSEEISIIERLSAFKSSVQEQGYNFRTGLVVDFRNLDLLTNEKTRHSYPLIWASHFVNGKVVHPKTHVKKQYILDTCKALLMPNQSYLLIKRLTAKEEKRRLQPALYLSQNKYTQYISTDNHLNFLTKKGANLSDEELFGFFVLLSSSLYDRYYRIMNGSTQVNAAELNSMPVPPKEDIIRFGQLAMKKEEITTIYCDHLLEEYYENQ